MFTLTSLLAEADPAAAIAAFLQPFLYLGISLSFLYFLFKREMLKMGQAAILAVVCIAVIFVPSMLSGFGRSFGVEAVRLWNQ